MPKGRPIRCRITSDNPDTYRNVVGQCRKYNLLRAESEERGELFILVSRKHHSLLDTIGKHDGVTVTEVLHFPENISVVEEEKEGRNGEKNTRTNGRVFSQTQKDILSGRLVQTEPFGMDNATICGIPMDEINEWAYFFSKGEFLRWHNITSRDFNRAVLALENKVEIYFTYTCPEEECGQIFSGRDALREFRTHVLSKRHSKAQ
jgi:hypothetical protein